MWNPSHKKIKSYRCVTIKPKHRAMERKFVGCNQGGTETFRYEMRWNVWKCPNASYLGPRKSKDPERLSFDDPVLFLSTVSFLPAFGWTCLPSKCHLTPINSKLQTLFTLNCPACWGHFSILNRVNLYASGQRLEEQRINLMKITLFLYMWWH